MGQWGCWESGGFILLNYVIVMTGKITHLGNGKVIRRVVNYLKHVLHFVVLLKRRRGLIKTEGDCQLFVYLYLDIERNLHLRIPNYHLANAKIASHTDLSTFFFHYCH